MKANKIDLIKAEVERLRNELIQEREKGFGSDTDDACILELQNVLTYIDSLQEEPVSEDLEQEIINYIGFPQEVDEDISTTMIRKAARHFANWQKKQDQETIELAEKEVKQQMIDKACKYLQDHREEVETEDNGISGWISDEFIEKFKKAMKD